MIRKFLNLLGVFIVALFLYKLFGGDLLALLNGTLDIIVTIADWGSDLLLKLWAEIKGM